MSSYLMREMAPFDEATWARIDGMVVQVVKNILVGRKFIPLVGPLGWGVEVAPLFGFAVQDGAFAAKQTTDYLPLKELRQEFMFRAKQMAIAAQTPFGLDLGAVAIAATELAKAEDQLIIDNLFDQALVESPLGDWGQPGEPTKAIAAATAKLLQGGCDAPYVLLVSPAMYARLVGLMNYGTPEEEMVEGLVKGGIFQSTCMPNDKVLVVSPAAWNMDLVVGQDVVTSYLGNAELDQRLRIFETVLLRIKRHESICVLK
jgi:uncharacterized linocin/CFP29 family protein